MLNAIKIKSVKVSTTTDFTDEAGLILRVTPKGLKTWKWRKVVAGKKFYKTLGTFPELSLQQARETAQQLSREAREKCGTEAREKFTFTSEEYERRLFKTVYYQWFSEKKLKVKFPSKIEQRFKTHILPAIGEYPVEQLNDKVLRKEFAYLQDLGRLPTLHRVISSVNEVLRWCVSEGLIDHVKTLYAKERFQRKPPVRHRAAVTPDELRTLLTPDMRASGGNFLMWSVYSMLRPKENAVLQWSWIDWTKQLITIPAEEMKMSRAHELPLTTQMLKILEKQRELMEMLGLQSKYVFFSTQSNTGHLSSQVLAHLFRRKGVNKVCTAHGLRATARTWLARMHVNEEVAEACLAHQKESATAAAYNREFFLEERREIMQKWCDFVDECV